MTASDDRHCICSIFLTDFPPPPPAAIPYPIHTVKGAFADGVDVEQYFPMLPTVYCVGLQPEEVRIHSCALTANTSCRKPNNFALHLS